MKTLAGSAAGVGDMIKLYEAIAPLQRNITAEEVGRSGAYLLSDMSRGITAETLHVDCVLQRHGVARADAGQDQSGSAERLKWTAKGCVRRRSRLESPSFKGISPEGGQFLVGLRPEGSHLAGCAEFPGGKVEPGEKPSAAAVRECAEETGLAVRSERSLGEREVHSSGRSLRLLLLPLPAA